MSGTFSQLLLGWVGVVVVGFPCSEVLVYELQHPLTEKVDISIVTDLSVRKFVCALAVCWCFFLLSTQVSSTIPELTASKQ